MPRRTPPIAAALRLLVVAALSLVAGCALPFTRHAPARTRLTAATVDVPLGLTGGRTELSALVNGSGPFSFEIDTGSSVVVVSPGLAEQLGLTGVNSPARVHGATGSRWVDLEKSALREVRLGGAVFEDVDCWILATPGTANGLLSLGLFADTLVTLDFPAGTVRFRRGSLPPADGRRILDYEIDGGVPVMTLDLGVPVELGLDSGFAGWVRVPPEIGEELEFVVRPRLPLRVVSVHDVTTDLLGKLDGALRIGEHVIENPLVQVGDGAPLLGVRILRHFAVTFDQTNERVRFERAPPAPEPGAVVLRAAQ